MILTLCAVEFDAAGTVTIDAAAASRRRQKPTSHKSANGVAMPTGEDDQDGHFFYNHPDRGGYFAA